MCIVLHENKFDKLEARVIGKYDDMVNKSFFLPQYRRKTLFGLLSLRWSYFEISKEKENDLFRSCYTYEPYVESFINFDDAVEFLKRKSKQTVDYKKIGEFRVDNNDNCYTRDKFIRYIKEGAFTPHLGHTNEIIVDGQLTNLLLREFNWGYREGKKDHAKRVLINLHQFKNLVGDVKIMYYSKK